MLDFSNKITIKETLEKLISNGSLMYSPYNYKIEIIFHQFNNGKLKNPPTEFDSTLDYDWCPVCELRTKLGNTDKRFAVMFFVPMKKVFRPQNFFERLFGTNKRKFVCFHEIDFDNFEIKLIDTVNKFIEQIK